MPTAPTFAPTRAPSVELVAHRPPPLVRPLASAVLVASARLQHTPAVRSIHVHRLLGQLTPNDAGGAWTRGLEALSLAGGAAALADVQRGSLANLEALRTRAAQVWSAAEAYTFLGEHPEVAMLFATLNDVFARDFRVTERSEREVLRFFYLALVHGGLVGLQQMTLAWMPTFPAPAQLPTTVTLHPPSHWTVPATLDAPGPEGDGLVLPEPPSRRRKLSSPPAGPAPKRIRSMPPEPASASAPGGAPGPTSRAAEVADTLVTMATQPRPSAIAPVSEAQPFPPPPRIEVTWVSTATVIPSAGAGVSVATSVRAAPGQGSQPHLLAPPPPSLPGRRPAPARRGHGLRAQAAPRAPHTTAQPAGAAAPALPREPMDVTLRFADVGNGPFTVTLPARFVGPSLATSVQLTTQQPMVPLRINGWEVAMRLPELRAMLQAMRRPGAA